MSGAYFHDPRPLLLALAVLAAACGLPAEAAPAPPSPIQTGPMPTEPPVTAIPAPATATAPARRLDPPVPTTTPFDPMAYVNALPYNYAVNVEAARIAYRTVALVRGWDGDTIARWESFLVDDVMHGESGWCWNVRGGATMTDDPDDGCAIARQGRREDAGFAQLIRVWYEYPTGVLCRSEGICSADAITASPWASMNAAVAAVEHDGSRPWCFNADARSYHPLCSTVPRYWP